MKRIALALLVLAGCAHPGNEVTITVKFVDREDLPYADEVQLCAPKADNTMLCVGVGLK